MGRRTSRNWKPILEMVEHRAVALADHGHLGRQLQRPGQLSQGPGFARRRLESRNHPGRLGEWAGRGQRNDQQ